MIRIGLLLVLLGAPTLALAQEEVGPQDLNRTTMDPVEKLVGVWRVDQVSGDAASHALKGRVLRIDRQSVATLTLGTCTNPSFAEQLGSITVACVGQNLATASWNPQEPGALQWTEGGVQAVLHRLSGTEALDSPPPAQDAAPQDAAPQEGEREEDAE